MKPALLIELEAAGLSKELNDAKTSFFRIYREYLCDINHEALWNETFHFLHYLSNVARKTSGDRSVRPGAAIQLALHHLMRHSLWDAISTMIGLELIPIPRDMGHTPQALYHVYMTTLSEFEHYMGRERNPAIWDESRAEDTPVGFKPMRLRPTIRETQAYSTNEPDGSSRSWIDEEIIDKLHF